MSDMSKGPRWWQASDGNWYPPELHPGYVSARTPPPATPPGATGTASALGRSPRREPYVGAHLVAVAFKTLACVTLLGGAVATWQIVDHLRASATASDTIAQAAGASAGSTVFTAAVLFFFG